LSTKNYNIEFMYVIYEVPNKKVTGNN
jgi:hypothetical protein